MLEFSRPVCDICKASLFKIAHQLISAEKIPVRDEIVIADHFRADETAFEVGVDDPGGLRRSKSRNIFHTVTPRTLTGSRMTASSARAGTEDL